MTTNTPHSELSLFLKQALRRPGRIVALSPSSSRLAAKMCRGIGPHTGPVIELGGGTGRITRAILASGIRQEDLAVYEINPEFVERLRAEFPSAHIQQAGAETLGEAPVNAPGAVISGLPLLTFPERLQNAIITAAFEKMRPGGVFVQFTYGFHPPIQRSLRQGHGLTWEVTGTEFWNLPPAQVFTFRKPTPGERKAA